MATTDIEKQIEQGARLDAALEKVRARSLRTHSRQRAKKNTQRLCLAILKQINDTSSNVQTVAVRALSLLVSKVQEAQVLDICTKLAESLITAPAANRDIYTVGLKTCIGKVPNEYGAVVSGKLASKLVVGTKEHPDATLDCLDIIADLLYRFARVMPDSHDAIIKLCLGQLSNPRPVLRKRAMACIGSLAQVIPDAALNRVVESLLAKIDSQEESSSIVQTIGVIGRSAGNRLGKHVERVVPLLLQHLSTVDDESMHNAHGDELREKIFQGLESFVLRCPNETTAHIDRVVEACKTFSTYDPNYNDIESDADGHDGAGNDDLDADHDDGDDDDDDDDAGDDDDSSWKVRRVAAKVLASLISARPELLEAFYAQCADLLVQRFRERVESVRVEVMATFAALLAATAASPTGAALLTARVPGAVRALVRVLKDRSQKAVKARSTALQTLTRMTQVLHGGLGAHLKVLVPAVVAAMQDKNAVTRLDALVFVHAALDAHAPAEMRPFAEALRAPILKSLSAEWFKIVAEALRATAALVRCTRPVEGGMFVGDGVDAKAWGAAVGQAVLPRLRANDIDQEIKVAAIECAGVLLAHLGGDVDDAVDAEVLALLAERMRNESTRLPALRALEACARSPARVDMAATIAASAGDLASFLRQASRELKQQSLLTLTALVDTPQHAALDGALLSGVLLELGKLVADKDMHVAQLALEFATRALEAKGPAAVPAVSEYVMPAAVKLARSSLIQGNALAALLRLFECVAPATDASALLNALTAESVKELSKPAVASLAECMACVLVASPQALREARLRALTAAVVDAGKEAQERYMAIVVLGAVGMRLSLAGRTPALETVLQQVFEQPEEALKQAAAVSLGRAAVGDTQHFVPVVMRALKDTGKSNQQQYHLLAALREIVSSSPASAAHLDLALILVVLEAHTDAEDEGVRTMVAECLGRLAATYPDEVFARLVCNESHGPRARWTRITAFKFALVHQGGPRAMSVLQSLFKVAVANFLNDPDLEVQKAALIAVNALLHHDAQLARQVFPGGDGLVPALLQLVEVREELQRKVDFGPFKHLVDDGLPVRKNAFACILVMVEKCPDLLVPLAGSQLMGIVCKGLSDAPDDSPDVPFISHQIIVQLCQRSSISVIAHVDALVAEFAKTLALFDKKSAGKEGKEDKDPEKLERRITILRSALRALDAMCALPGASEERSLADLAANAMRIDFVRQAAEAEGLQSVLRAGGADPSKRGVVVA